MTRIPLGGPSRRNVLLGAATVVAAQNLSEASAADQGSQPRAAQGLRISEFLTSDDQAADQRPALSAAIDRLVQDGRFSVLDLEGRKLTLSRPIVIDDSATEASSKPLTIANGTLAPTEDWPAGDVPMVRFFRSGAGSIAHWGIESVAFKCHRRASAIFVDGPYVNLRFRWLDIDDPHSFAIRTRTHGGPGGNLRVEYCDILGSSAPELATERTLIALDLDNENDGKIFGNRIARARTALKGTVGSFLISQNHFWQGSRVGLPRRNHTPVIHLGARSTNVISVNYLDNGYILLEEGLGIEGENRTLGYCQCTSNIFTLGNAYSGASFVVVKPMAPDRKLANMIIRDNQFRNVGKSAETVRPFVVDTSAGGSLSPGGGRNLVIDGNYYWGHVQPQASSIEKVIPLDGRKKFPIDVSGRTPFDLDADVATSLAVQTHGPSPGACYYQRVSGKSGNLVLDNAVKGRACIVLTVNGSDIFG